MSLATQISALATAIGAKIKTASTSIPAKTVTGNYTLVDADAGTEVQVNSATAVTITVGSMTANKVVMVRQIGTGQVTISGSTVVSYAVTTKLAGQRALAVVRIDSPTIAYVNGELAAS